MFCLFSLMLVYFACLQIAVVQSTHSYLIMPQHYQFRCYYHRMNTRLLRETLFSHDDQDIKMRVKRASLSVVNTSFPSHLLKKQESKVSPHAKLSIIEGPSCSHRILFDLLCKSDFETLIHSKNNIHMISRKFNHDFSTKLALQDANENRVKTRSS